MDETTEPVIAVLGHPIAGNPSQFALETALESIRADCRVLSFEVTPDDLAAALEGAQALGLRGVLLDAGLAPRAKAWCERRPGGLRSAETQVDCLFREPENPHRLIGTDVARQWLAEAISRHFQLRGRSVEQALWIGRDRESAGVAGAERLAGVAVEQRSTAERLGADRIARSDLIFLAPSAESPEKQPPAPLDSDRWPVDDASTLVVDLTAEGHPEAARLRDRGYTVLSIEQRQVAVLHRCLRLWIGQTVPEELLGDAVEEYLAV